MTTEIGFIGAGNMAGAIISGILREQLLKASDIGVYDIAPQQLEQYRRSGHPVYDSIQALVQNCSRIVLSVKPQQISDVLSEVKPVMTQEKVVCSIAAGVTAKAVHQAIGFACKTILIMPNTPLLLGCGATALARVEPTTQEEFESVRRLFAAAGIAVEIPADRMNEVIPVNGSSPAFVYRFVQVLVQSAVDAGIEESAALALICQTLSGSARMLLDSGKSPQQLIDMVCSPGGTTLAAMQAMEEHGFEKSLAAGFQACVRRAEELSR